MRTENRFLSHPKTTGLALAGALLLLAEGGLRLASPEIWRFVAEARRLHRYDPAWVVRLEPDAHVRFVLHRRDGSLLYDFAVDTDALGCRVAAASGPAPASAPGARDVHALGDSFTMGWGVDGDASWPARLDALQGGRGNVVNLGVDGFGALAATGRSLEVWPARPARAAVYLFSPNDFDDDARATASVAEGALVHAGRRGLDALRRATWLANAPFVAAWWVRFRPSRAMTPAGPARPGLLREAAPSGAGEPAPPDATADAVLAFGGFAETHGARFVVLAFDEPEGRRMGAFCRAHGIETHLLAVPEELRIPGEGHLSAEGNRQVADFVSGLLAGGIPATGTSRSRP